MQVSNTYIFARILAGAMKFLIEALWLYTYVYTFITFFIKTVEAPACFRKLPLVTRFDKS